MQLVQNEDINIKERPMYRKRDVYLGLREISFEELKAQKWEMFQKCQTPKRSIIDIDTISRKWDKEYIAKLNETLDESLTDSLEVRTIIIIIFFCFFFRKLFSAIFLHIYSPTFSVFF